jgi:hypothetical protein
MIELQEVTQALAAAIMAEAWATQAKSRALESVISLASTCGKANKVA